MPRTLPGENDAALETRRKLICMRRRESSLIQESSHATPSPHPRLQRRFRARCFLRSSISQGRSAHNELYVPRGVSRASSRASIVSMRDDNTALCTNTAAICEVSTDICKDISVFFKTSRAFSEPMVSVCARNASFSRRSASASARPLGRLIPGSSTAAGCIDDTKGKVGEGGSEWLSFDLSGCAPVVSKGCDGTRATGSVAKGGSTLGVDPGRRTLSAPAPLFSDVRIIPAPALGSVSAGAQCEVELSDC